MATLPLPSAVVAAVTDSDGKWLGTAFYVGPRTALTCAHVIGERTKDEIRLLPVDGPPLLHVEELRIRPIHDIACLDVTQPAASWLPLKATWAPGLRVVSHGFSSRYPAARFPSGHPMDPCEISGETEVEWPSGRAKVLRLTPSNADEGFSGGPAVDVVSGAVIGILRFRSPTEGGTYAIPAETVLSQWPDLASFGDGLAMDLATVNPMPGSWLTFDWMKFHCVAVDSESARRDPSVSLLSDVMRSTFSQDDVRRIWEAFRGYWRERVLLRGYTDRALAPLPTAANLQLASLSVRDAYSSRARLAETIRLVVESDLALFDVTNFEPGVMLLLGVRAANRRGVTIASHGTWLEGSPLPRPFNLADLPLASHKTPEGIVGIDPRVNLLIDRIVSGFEQMGESPRYLDLPAYDGIRLLGPGQRSWSTIGLDSRVLVLCSYDDAFYGNWRNLRLQIQAALSQADLRPQVARLVDLRRPQLVSQALYEMIRRCSACVTDWTRWSPSTFFELGVRLAISPWGSVQVVDDQWLDDYAANEELPALDQAKFMREVFEPIGYRGNSDSNIGSAVAGKLLEIRNTAGIEGGHYIRSVVIDSLARVQEAQADIYTYLTKEADSLHHPDTKQTNAPQALFPEIKEVKVEHEDAALQRRIAAWLYLDGRLGAGSLPDGDRRKEEWRSLGNTVVDGLYASGTDDDVRLATQIEMRLET